MTRASLIRSLVVTAHRAQSKSTIPPKLVQLQKKFQEKNDLPVHLKGGAGDKILYLTTVSLAGIGLVYLLVFLVTTYIID